MLARNTNSKGERTMIKTSLTFLIAGLSVFAATSSEAGQRIPLSAAMAQCDKQSVLLDSDIMDGGGVQAANSRKAQQYRSCVYAKSGRYPQVSKRNGISISGTARFGIVVSD
jgi:hypothetical protein